MKYHKLTENAAKPNGFWGKLMIKAMNKGHSALTDWALDHISIPSNGTLLDIGCSAVESPETVQRVIYKGETHR